MQSDINFFKVSPQKINLTSGIALIAAPGLNDFYFKRSVVLLTEHNEKGTSGFIINKLVDVEIADLIEDFPRTNSLLMMGGPVQVDSIHYLHTLGDLIPNSIHICNSVFWGGDFDIVKELFLLNKISNNQIKFFIGHSGWSAGQLLEEVEQESWALMQINENDIMGDGTNLWKILVERLGEEYRMWINYPENPYLN